MELSRRKILIAGVLAAVLAAVFLAVQPHRYRFSGTFAPDAEIKTSYEPGKEVVKISVVNGSFPSYTDDSGGDLVLTAENFSEKEDVCSNLTIRGYSDKNSHGYWAEYRRNFSG
ncbi:MAG: hypothetical protein ABEJ36_01720 [Candidatus Nanosalina sp.]